MPCDPGARTDTVKDSGDKTGGKTCQEVIVLVKDYHPKERCDLVRMDDCQDDPPERCRDVMKTVCVPPTKSNKARQMECNGTLIFNNP